MHEHFPEGVDWTLVEHGPVASVSCGVGDRIVAVLGGPDTACISGGGTLAERRGCDIL